MEIDYEAILNKVVEQLYLWAPRVVAAIAIYFFGKWTAKIIRSIIRKMLRRANQADMLVGFLSNIVYGLLLAFVVIAALQRVGVPMTSAVAILGAAGLAIGFALQDSLSNFASGVMVVLFRPFKIGDFVEAAGVTGVVQEIQIFVTVLKTGDNKKMIIPNGKIFGGNITNYSANDTRRVDLVFGIGYADDLLKAKQVLERIVNAHKLVLKDPAPAIAVTELARNRVNFKVRPWVKAGDYWTVHDELTETVKLELDKEGLSAR